MKLLKLNREDWYFLDDENRVLIYDLICDKVEREGIKNFTLNVLSDHVHLVITYEENNLSKLIKNIKWAVSFNYSKLKWFSKKWDWVQNKIWARWFSITYLDTDEHYERAINYTKENHDKHWIKSIYQFVNRGF
jgi:REP element-mobilizing transposase RayT